jgi:uncharacterized iron-regulated membrane protein
MLFGGVLTCRYATSEGQMTPWRRWVLRPQGLLVRKIVFQLHLWVGIAVGLYVVVISISGSAIVFRRELYNMEWRRKMVVTDERRARIRIEEMEQRVKRAYPKYEVVSIHEPGAPNQPDVALLEHGNSRIARLFDPYTGADLGDLAPGGPAHFFDWLADLHDNLLSGLTGRTLNGLGSFLIVLLSCTGAVIWWPGIKNWRRSVAIKRKARPARFIWDLHSAVGFWCWAFVLIWGISGICLCFPGTLNFLLSSRFRLWITLLHFGRFNGITEALWTIIGLAPAILAATGALMWWNRVLSKKPRHFQRRKIEAL